MGRPTRITAEEIDIAFRDEAMRSAFPPILSPEKLGQLLGISVSTIYLWIAKGKFAGAVTKIGKHQLIWRNRAIEVLFNKGKPISTGQILPTNRGIEHDNDTDQ